ncbi:hypothetical protein [Arthrobacter sp. GMC3]|uniref:hypothetical protein n=1 Tax=Arthrobacter sp. GMC3 TaxID=2058894 RepID=UPI000CE49499|nr:hypothetical protein [Arthrobacter sp. GMC3]
MTEHNASTTAVASERKSPGISKALLGPLTARDLTVLGAVLVIFVASVLPITLVFGLQGNLWSVSGMYFIGIGVILPLLVGALFTIRRLSPDVKLRVGSLSVDQFASVVAGFATAYFFLSTVIIFDIAYLVGLIGALVLLAATVLAPWIPAFAADFAGRTEVPAHPAARDAVPAVARPAAPKPPLAIGAGNQSAPVAAGNPYAMPATAGQGQGADASAPTSPWNAAPSNASHTPGGQIYTPATGGPAPYSAAAAASAAAAGTAATSAPATAVHASPPANEAQNAAPASPEPAAAVVGESGVVPSQESTADAPATMLNPKVIEAETPAPVAESIGATVDPEASRTPVVAEPFWFAVDRPQNVVDEITRLFVFKLTPGSWILALEDRGTSYLVQDSHGKTGVLLDLVGIERAPESQ